MSVSIELIKELRESTGIGLGLCKKALEAVDGDVEAAKDWLKKQGHAQAAKVADRDTTQGLVAFAKEGNAGALITLGCETDFVSGNEQFGAFANKLAFVAAQNAKTLNAADDILQAFNDCKMEDGTAVSQALVELISSIKENIIIKNVVVAEKSDGGDILGYVYRTTVNAIADIGSRGAMVSYKGDAEVAKNVGMHIVANNTKYLKSEDIPADFVEKEKKIFKERMLEEGKPENMIDKIVEGKVGQIYKENALLDQPYFKEDKMSIAQYTEKNNTTILAFTNLKV